MSYSRRHYRLVSPPADTAEDIVARQRHREALAAAQADVEARFPEGATPENAADYAAYQAARIHAHVVVPYLAPLVRRRR